MNDESFASIFKFYEATTPDVGGRGADPLTDEALGLMERLSSGGANAAERGRLAELLKEHPEWIQSLVARLNPGA